MAKRQFVPTKDMTVYGHDGNVLPEKGKPVPDSLYYYRLESRGEGKFDDDRARKERAGIEKAKKSAQAEKGEGSQSTAAKKDDTKTTGGKK